MKDITKLLERDNLSGKERILTLVRNQIHERRTGKSVLTDSDISNISRKWKGAEPFEIDVYNHHLEVWNRHKNLALDMQTLFLRTHILYCGVQSHLALCLGYKPLSEYIKKYLHGMGDGDESYTDMFVAHTGLDYDALVQKEAFNRLAKEYQVNLECLDYDPDYYRGRTNFESQIAQVLGEKDEVSEQQAILLVDIFARHMRWDDDIQAHSIFKRTLDDYSMIDLAKSLAIRHGITYESDDDLCDKLEDLQDLKGQTRILLHEIIMNRSLFYDYVPWCWDDSRVYTDIPPCELITQFNKVKKEVVEEIDALLESKQLLKESIVIEYGQGYIKYTVLRGEGLCKLVKYSYALEYQEQVKLLEHFGILFRLLDLDKFKKRYSHFLSYLEVNKQFEYIYGDNPDDNGQIYIDDLDLYLTHLNRSILRALADVVGESGIYTTYTHPILIFTNELMLDLKKIKPTTNRLIDDFQETAEECLGAAWDQTKTDT